MSKKTFVIMDTDGRYYSSFCDAFLAIAHCRVLVFSTSDFAGARKFRSLRWATYRARFLSINAFGYYYVYEAAGKENEQKLILRNEEVIEKIRKKDSETMEAIHKMIAEWETNHDSE